MRNPWGDETEWKGPWGDHSKEWNEKRKRIAYKRMETTAVEKAEIGEADGVFWIAFSDFTRNFTEVYVCQFFDENEYTQLFVESEWSIDKGTAGGCPNFDTCGQNPQYKLTVNTSSSVEVFMSLQVESKEKIAFGFIGSQENGSRIDGYP